MAGIDPLSAEVAPLFHPRRDTWSTYFDWHGTLTDSDPIETVIMIKCLPELTSPNSASALSVHLYFALFGSEEYE